MATQPSPTHAIRFYHLAIRNFTSVGNIVAGPPPAAHLVATGPADLQCSEAPWCQ